MRTILACDLSLTSPGFAVVEVENDSLTVKHISHVRTSSKKSTGHRLFQIYRHLEDIIQTYDATDFVFEKGFNKFALATQQIQRTVGVCTLCIFYYHNEYVIEEITPTQVKALTTGSGKASKEQVAESLEQYVGKLNYRTDDESDAVAVAVALAKQKGWI